MTTYKLVDGPEQQKGTAKRVGSMWAGLYGEKGKTVWPEYDDYPELIKSKGLIYFKNDEADDVDPERNVFIFKHGVDHRFRYYNIYSCDWEFFGFFYEVGPYYRDMTLKCSTSFQDGSRGRPFSILAKGNGLQGRMLQGVLDDDDPCWEKNLTTEEIIQVERAISRVYSSAQYKTITTRQWARAE